MLPFDVRSRITAVTIYRRGAMVTRRAELPAEKTDVPQRVQLVGLPLGLDDSSVRVEVDSARVVAGDLQVTLAVPGTDESLAPPTNADLEAAALELARARARISELERAKVRLGELEPGPRGQVKQGRPPQASPTTARLQLIEFRRQRVAAVSDALASEREALRSLEQALVSLRERERRASSARNTRANELRKAALIDLHHGDEGASDRSASASAKVKVTVIELRYFIPGARWAPSYIVRLDASMQAAALELRAMVGQSTGEDWAGVALTLSTATPQQWTELPELESRRIGRRQAPPAKKGWRPPPIGAEALYADYDRGLGEPPAAPTELAAPMAKPRPPERTLAPQGHPPPPPAMRPQAARSPAPMPPGGPVRSRSVLLSDDESPMPGLGALMPMPTHAEQSKSSGFGGLVGGAIDSLSAAFGSDGSMAMDTRGGGGSPSKKRRAQAPPREPEVLAGRELLDYGRLRMFTAANRRRGALRRVTVAVQYEQTIVEQIPVDEALGQIGEALDWAALLETEDAPEGHRWPSAEGGFDYAYVASAPVDLRSTGGFNSLPIDTREAKARPRYVSVPRESQDVFRIVSLDNPFDAPLLPGPVDVYVDGKFMLGSALELTPTAGKIALGLGVEQAIKIARNVSFNEDSSGMFKRQLALSHTLALEVKNNLPSPALVEIRERVPVVAEALADSISVELGAVEPSWEDYEPKRPGPELEGGHRWKIEVPAGGKRELSATYVVKLPTNHELVGGNRRES